MRPQGRPPADWAVYKGETLLVMGTAQECADELGVKVETIYFYKSPAYMRRLEKRNARNYRVSVKLDEEEEE